MEKTDQYLKQYTPTINADKKWIKFLFSGQKYDFNEVLSKQSESGNN